MIHTPAAVAVPLRTDDNGVIRIGDTRVTLVTLIQHYNSGDNAEALHEGFPILSLSEVYAVIAYYLANKADIDTLIQEVGEQANQAQRDWHARYTPQQRQHQETLEKRLKSI